MVDAEEVTPVKDEQIDAVENVEEQKVEEQVEEPAEPTAEEKAKLEELEAQRAVLNDEPRTGDSSQATPVRRTKHSSNSGW